MEWVNMVKKRMNEGRKKGKGENNGNNDVLVHLFVQFSYTNLGQSVVGT